MHKPIFLLSLTFLSTSFAKLDPSLEEAFFVRRIADFWQEGEVRLATLQIEEFLQKYPESIHASKFHWTLGNLYFQEKKFSLALEHYEQVQESSEELFRQKMHSFYLLEKEEELIGLATSLLDNPLYENSATYFLAIHHYRNYLKAPEEKKEELAKKALVFFEKLLDPAKQALSKEPNLSTLNLAAHLFQRIKNFQKAEEIYQSILTKNPLLKEEMLLQIALCKKEYDEEKALELLTEMIRNIDETANPSDIFSKASYERLLLQFKMGLYEQIAIEKETTFLSLKKENKEHAQLLFGKALLALGRSEEALVDLKKGPLTEESLNALIHAAYLAKKEDSFEEIFSTILANAKTTKTLEMGQERLSELEGKAHLYLAKIYKEKNLLERAWKEIEAIETIEQALEENLSLERVDLLYKNQEFARARKESLLYLQNHPESLLASLFWKERIQSARHLSAEVLLEDLEELFTSLTFLDPKEQDSYLLLFAKTLYETSNFSRLIPFLEKKLSQAGLENQGFGQEIVVTREKANFALLLALCYQNEAEKCVHYGEMALEGNDPITLSKSSSLHLLLYNSYLDLKNSEKAAEHLFVAFEQKESISNDNLFWLANFYLEKEPKKAERVLEFLIASDLSEDLLSEELALYQKSELTQLPEEKALLLEKLESLYHKSDQIDWRYQEEVELSLALSYLQKGEMEEAVSLLEGVIDQRSTPRLVRKKAQLELAKIKALDEETKEEAIILLKTIVLEKELIDEPIHLNAAVTYVDLLGTSLEKRLFLLEKMEKDFSSEEDLLSKDYHKAKEMLPKQKEIYEEYMSWLSAEILWVKSLLSGEESSQKELKAKAKELFLKMSETSENSELKNRSLQRMQNA